MTMRSLGGGLLAVLVAGCADTNVSAPPATSDGVIPLVVGAEWTYAIADSGDKKFSFRTDSVRTMRITRDTIVAGARWYWIDGSEFATLVLTQFVRNTESGLFHLWTADPRYIVTKPVYEYPPRVGEIFSGGSLGVYPLRAFVADTVIIVPAGTFHCVGYEWFSTGPNGVIARPNRWQFLAPGVGLVKDVTPIATMGDSVLTSRVKVLTSYKKP